MLKSETFFSRLIAIDTLISFDGVIASAADFQLKLISLIEQFSKALIAEDHDQAECETLCLILCGYFDQRLIGKDRGDMLRWHRYSLQHYFYGFSDSSNENNLVAQLEVPLASSNEVMFSYAWKMLILMRQTEGDTETVIALRIAHRTRYFSRTRASTNLEQAQCKSSSIRKGDADAPRMMIFIIGPFAKKWFSQFDLFANEDGRIVWIVAEHAQTLADRMAHKERNHPDIALTAFFPLLADGVESSSIMIEQIMAWQHAFSSIPLTASLPCLLGVYTQMSQQRYSHDPDRAVWCGKLPFSPVCQIELEAHLLNLVNQQDTCNDGKDLFAIQRHAMGSTLVAWLAEQRIMGTLQNLFNSTQLKLAGVTFADHGQGFTRHGAWSHWLAEKYAIVPGLSASIAMPPLPDIILPLIEPTPESSTIVPMTTIPPLPARKLRHRSFSIPLMLAVCMAVAIGFYLKWIPAEFNARLSQITFSEKVPFSKQKPDSELAFFTASATPLFEPGGSKLAAGSEKALEALIFKVTQAPHQMFLVIGHADNTGSTELNNTLSVERAKVVRAWLAENSGLSINNFIVEGAGNSRPIASNETQEGRALNRRVEIIPLPIQGK